MKSLEKVGGSGAERPLIRPLSPTTYLLRNWGKSLPLGLVIILAVMLVAGIVSLINSIPLSIRTIYLYSKETVVIGPRGDPTRTPYLANILKKESPVPLDRVMLVRASSTQVKSIVGKWPFTVTGLTPDDMKYFLSKQDVTGLTGSYPEVGKPEVVISEPVARNLNLKIGSVVQRPDNNDSYSPMPVKVVGIAQTRRWLILGDKEYQEKNHFPPIDIILGFAKTPEAQVKLDKWAVERFKNEKAMLFAYHILERDTGEMFKILYRILNVVIFLLVAVITTMMGMLINIYQSQRLVEFGLLQAIGYRKSVLIKRVLSETLVVVILGWLAGVAAAYGLLRIADAILMHPSAFALDPLDKTAYLYTLPIPFSILGVAVLTVVAKFKKFDPVSIVERRLV